MTLIERAQVLTQLAIRRHKQEEREHIAQGLRTRTAHLEKLATRLELACERTAVLRQMNHVVSPWAEPPTAAFRTYDAAEKSTKPGYEAWEKFVRAFEKHVVSADKSVGEDIERVRKRTLKGVSSGAIASYEADPSTQQQASRLRGQLEELKSAKWEAVSASELLTLITGATTLRAEFLHMQESGSSQELREFLADARGREGASLSKLTNAIREELEERKLLDRIRLRLE